MTQVCIEYHKNYKYSKIHKSVYFNNEVEKLYNYRSLKRKVGHNVSEFILGHKVSEFIHNISKYNVAKLSPNYWSKNYPTLTLPNDPNTTPTTDQRED
jgi:hypothetical protein